MPLGGTVTTSCPACAGSGKRKYERERRLDELYDHQIQALFEAEMFREYGDEEQRKKQKQQQRRAQQAANAPSGMGGHGF